MMNATQKVNNRRIHDIINTLVNMPDAIIAKPIADLILDNIANNDHRCNYRLSNKSIGRVIRIKTVVDEIHDGIKLYLHINDDYKYPACSKIKSHLNDLLNVFNKIEYTTQPWDEQKISKTYFCDFYNDIMIANIKKQQAILTLCKSKNVYRP